MANFTALLLRLSSAATLCAAVVSMACAATTQTGTSPSATERRASQERGAPRTKPTPLPLEGAQLWSSPDGGSTWLRVQSIAGSPSKLIIGRVNGQQTAFVTVVDTDHLGVWESDDGSRWTHTADLPQAAGNWSRGLAVDAVHGRLLIATTTGLWSLSLTGGTARRMSVTGQVTDVVVDPSGSAHALSVGADGAFAQFSQVAGDTWRTQSVAADHLALINGEPYALSLDVPTGSGMVGASSVDGAGSHLLRTAVDGIWRSASGGAHWIRSSVPGNPDFVRVATAPGFASSGVALAAVFRGPLWKTADFGATWQSLAGPSGEPWGLGFMTDSIIIAIEAPSH